MRGGFVNAVVLAGLIAHFGGPEAAAALLPLLLIFGAAIGGRYPGAERLLRLAARLAAWRARRRRAAAAVRGRPARARAAARRGRVAGAMRGPRAPPAGPVTA